MDGLDDLMGELKAFRGWLEAMLLLSELVDDSYCEGFIEAWNAKNAAKPTRKVILIIEDEEDGD